MANRATVTMAVDFMRDPAGITQFDAAQPITKLLHLIWTSRPDLQSVFDIGTPEGQAGFRSWAADAVKREYGVDAFSDEVSDNASQGAAENRGLLGGLKILLRKRPATEPALGQPGATLIGYTYGVLGMGEHVRMSAEALSSTRVPYGVLDIETGSGEQPGEQTARYPRVTTNRFRANIFHVNADQMLPTYCRLGSDFFRNRYNIGFWAWELAKWPAPWNPVLEMVDEIWAPSRFIADCLTSATEKPVTYMPLCVELPPFERLPRARFGLPERDCLFLFAFDFNSYIERKNPFAAIRAFKKAFPSGTERAGLVVKVMKADTGSDKWREMVELIGGDARIHVINEVMSRSEVLALIDACDCFVSLHRSEGFGRGPAEAMYLGKPVIATGYSGNTDFTRPDSSLLVDYTLVPVEKGEYVHGDGQVWADADVDHAARLLRRVLEGGSEVETIASRGKAVMRNEFSNSAVGRNMERRLLELGLLTQ